MRYSPFYNDEEELEDSSITLPSPLQQLTQELAPVMSGNDLLNGGTGTASKKKKIDQGGLTGEVGVTASADVRLSFLGVTRIHVFPRVHCEWRYTCLYR